MLTSKNIHVSTLRSFGLTAGIGLCTVFGVALPWLKQSPFPFWPWFIGGLLVATGILKPELLDKLYKIWMRLGLALGWVNSRILLALFFYGMMLPFAIIMRLFGKDPMTRKFDSKIDSYRVLARKRPDHSHFERPF